ncbi:MAG: UGSC family (seleno)protein [Microbacterium sp.]
MPDAILDPTGRPPAAVPAAGGRLAPRPDVLTGLRVGLLDNTKHNALLLLTRLGELLVAEGGAAAVSIVETKTNFSVPVDDRIVGRYREACDVVVTGVGDCGSCSAAAVADGIAFERAGVPAAVVLTDAFTATGRTMAAVQGAPDYEWITTAHPMAVLGEDEVAARARTLLPEVIRAFTAGAAR